MKSFIFDADLAVKYGVDCAIMIQNFAFWIEHNEANDMHFHDGRYWTYNTVEAFTKIFPFWSKAQIRRILQKLQDADIIMTGNYNSHAYERKLWYAFTDSFQNQQMDLSKLANGKVETGKSDIDSSIYNNSSNTDNKQSDSKTYIPQAAFSEQHEDAKSNALFEAKDTNILTPTYITNTGKEKENTKEKEKVTRPRRTSEALCLFENSRYYDYELFEAEFKQPEFENVDISYYYHAVADWSSQKGKKMKDWIATARNFMRSDREKGKLHEKPVLGTLTEKEKAQKELLEFLEYRRMMGYEDYDFNELRQAGINL